MLNMEQFQQFRRKLYDISRSPRFMEFVDAGIMEACFRHLSIANPIAQVCIIGPFSIYWIPSQNLFTTFFSMVPNLIPLAKRRTLPPSGVRSILGKHKLAEHLFLPVDESKLESSKPVSISEMAIFYIRLTLCFRVCPSSSFLHSIHPFLHYYSLFLFSSSFSFLLSLLLSLSLSLSLLHSPTSPASAPPSCLWWRRCSNVHWVEEREGMN